MSADQVLQIVAETAGDTLGVAAGGLDVDADLESLGIDELVEVEMIIDLEEQMSMKIPNEDLGRMGSLRGLADYLDKRMKKN